MIHLRKVIFCGALLVAGVLANSAHAVVLYTTVEELEQAAPSAGGGKILAPQSSWTHSNLTKKIEPARSAIPQPAPQPEPQFAPVISTPAAAPPKAISQQAIPMDVVEEKPKSEPSWAYKKSLDGDGEEVSRDDKGSSPRIYAEPVISTLGLGSDVGLYVSEKVGLRFNANYFSYNSSSIKYESVDVSPKLNLLTVGVIGDYYFDGGFFVSGGLYYNGNRVSARGNVTDEIKINEVTYTKYDVASMSAEIDFNKFAPYLGTGFRGQISNDWFGMFEVGALLHGAPQTKFEYVIANEEIRQQLQSDIDAEITSFNDDIGRFIILPVIKFGVTYKFN